MAAAIRARLFAEDQREGLSSPSSTSKRRPASAAAAARTRRRSAGEGDENITPQRADAADEDPYASAGQLVRRIKLDDALASAEGDAALGVAPPAALAAGERLLLVGPQLWAVLPKISAWIPRLELSAPAPADQADEVGAVGMPRLCVGAVAISTARNELLCVDTRRARVCVFTADGRLRRTIGEGGRGKLTTPTAIGADGFGNVVVFDAGPAKLLTYKLENGALVRLP
eukprot:SAG11_NODE_5469_length_1551_cov_2.046832_2_plen_229_part_00